MTGLRYLSVCSGIDAATVAWHPLGWRPVAFAEVDKFPAAVLAHHYPSIPNLGDMTTFEDWPDDPIDLLVGGTPCQSFSVAGLRAGLADPRGNLMLTYGDIAARRRPRWVVWENVPGVLSSNGGRDFAAFLSLLGQLGYGWAYRVLDAQYVRVDGFHGAVPQRRRRVFVVGHLGDWRRAAAVLFDAASLRGDPPPRREAGQLFADSLTVGANQYSGFCGEPVVASTGDVAPTLNANFGDKLGLENQHINGGGDYSLPPVSLCLNAGAMGRIDAESETLIPVTGGGFDVAHALRGEGFDASEDGTGRGTPLVPVAYRTTGNDGAYETGDVVGALTTTTDPNAQAVAFDLNQITSATNRSRPDPTVHHTLPAISCPPHLATPWAVRRLTPCECERLMGFPDGYTDVPYGRRNWTPDGPRYKALGNSMAVNVMRWIGRRIEMVEGIQ